MALTSAQALVTATALVLAAVAAMQAAAAPPAPIGLPGCKTACGNVSVPYPFGIQKGCYREGYNLTCDTTSRGSPRLLLGDGTLRVVHIFPENSTVRVLRDGPMVNVTHVITSGGLSVTIVPIFAGGHYRVAFANELIVFGCEFMATLVHGPKWFADGDGRSSHVSCASFCPDGEGISIGDADTFCSNGGCCQASLIITDWFHMPTELRLRPLEFRNNSEWDSDVSVFLAEKGWMETSGDPFELKNGIPLILRWDIMQGLALPKSDEKGDPVGSAPAA